MYQGRVGGENLASVNTEGGNAALPLQSSEPGSWDSHIGLQHAPQEQLE